MENPFKFGTLVDTPYFTDRNEELNTISQLLNSANHIILISPRRFGKSSLVKKAIAASGRPYIMLNMQQVTSVEDLSSMLLRAAFKIYPLEKFKHLISNFRIVPTISTNAMTDTIEVSFKPQANTTALLEDALSFLEKASRSDNRLIVVLDEFQELVSIENNLDKRMRAIMQEQQNINYIFLGSQESMMTEIFEKVKSPFYHFGQLLKLGKIPETDFHEYLTERLSPICNTAANISSDILKITTCHPYYTQQLAARVWDLLVSEQVQNDAIEEAVESLMSIHDLDFERLWLTFNNTDRKVLQILSKEEHPQENRQIATSTIYSAIKKLVRNGYVIKNNSYEVEDPFFKRWIARQMK